MNTDISPPPSAKHLNSGPSSKDLISPFSKVLIINLKSVFIISFPPYVINHHVTLSHYYKSLLNMFISDFFSLQSAPGTYLVIHVFSNVTQSIHASIRPILTSAAGIIRWVKHNCWPEVSQNLSYILHIVSYGLYLLPHTHTHCASKILAVSYCLMAIINAKTCSFLGFRGWVAVQI